jgi:hypothetical protein
MTRSQLAAQLRGMLSVPAGTVSVVLTMDSAQQLARDLERAEAMAADPGQVRYTATVAGRA